MMNNLSSSAILLFKRISMNVARPIFTIVLVFASTLASLATTITSFLPASGQVGTLLTVKGTGFTVNSTLSIGGKPAIIVSSTATQIVGMVMPGAITGNVAVNTTNAATIFTVTETPYPIAQQGRKMADATPSPNNTIQGTYRYNAKAVALSADGNTAIVAGQDVSGAGAAIYVRQNNRWQKVSPFVISESSAPGISVAISADGSTAVIGGFSYTPVPVLVLRKVNGSWSQPLVEHLPDAAYDPNAYPQEGHPFITGSTVSVTADGKTIVAGSGVHESAYTKQFGLYGDGVSIFNRSGEGWNQVPTPFPSRQYLGTPKSEGSAVPDVGAAISADGKTMALIATHHFVKTNLNMHSGYVTKPYTIIFARATKTSNTWVPQQLLGEFSRVQLSADGNTLLATDDVEQQNDINFPGTGATHIYTRNGSTWSLAQDIHEDGEAVLSADASTLLIANNATVYTRVGGSYVKKVELKPGYYATSSALSADGSTALVGNPYDSGTFSSGTFTGAAYAFSSSQSSPAGVQATNITYTGVASVTGTTMGIGWTNGSGTGRAVFMKQTAAIDEPLPDDRYYKNKAQFKTGEQVGTSGWYCVYNGTGNNAVVQSLVGKAAYRIAILEYGGTIEKPLYLPLAPLLGAATPQIGPPLTQASAFVSSNRKTNSGTLKWTNGSGVKRAVFLKFTGGGGGGTPSPEELLAAGNTVRPYENNYDVWQCVYNGTGSTVNLAGLLASTTYAAAVLEYNGDSNDPKYLFPAATTYVRTADEYKPARLKYMPITATTATPAWVGAGARFSEEQYGTAVFVRLTADAMNTDTPSPANVYYSANARFGSGNQIGTSGWYCVYNGPSRLEETDTVRITGLKTGKHYNVALVTYIGPINAPQYIPGAQEQTITTTWVAPTGYATGLAFSNTAAKSTTLSWINSNGDGRAVFLKLGTSGALNVDDGAVYPANSTFGLGGMAGTNGWYCVYDGTGNSVNITGLNPASTYRAIVLEYNSAVFRDYTIQMYNLTRYNGANVTTTAAPSLVLTTNQKRLLVEQDLLADNATPELNIHQGISPNGDGQNDVFTIDGIGAYPQNTVKIMNSNGDVVYTATGYDNYLKAFDGHSAKGDLQKAGTYFYSLEYKKGADTIRKTGYLVIKY